MTTAYSLRPFRAQDSAPVVNLVFSVLEEHGITPDPENEDADLYDLETIYLKSGGLFSVLQDSTGRIVGCAGVVPRDHETCELRRLYLAPRVRGRGLGRRLLEHALAYVRTQGYRSVILDTAAVFQTATSLYRNYGFTRQSQGSCSSRCNLTYSLDL